jgi:hypothetical protein
MDDGILLKYNTQGEFLWGGTFGSASFQGNDLDLPVAMRLDEFGNVYLAGSSLNGFDADLVKGDEVQFPLDRGGDFIIKYDSDGKVIWTRNFTDCKSGGENTGRIYDLQYHSGKLFVCGSYTCSNDFDPDPVVEQVKNMLAGEDMFVFFCDTSGKLRGLEVFNGTGHERLTHIAYLPSGNLSLLGTLRTLIPIGGGPSVLSEVDMNPGAGLNSLQCFSVNSGAWVVGGYQLIPQGIFSYDEQMHSGFKLIHAQGGTLEVRLNEDILESSLITVYDLCGRVLLETKPGGKYAGEILRLEGLPSGMLIVQLRGEAVSSLKFFMIE